mmetsp:Transcript_33949/g.100047  ORF Transcript_33949/g.100047 Transcript_33949/m.100047 type:complete len:247 (-) Transcript_33949:162-902(-)
MNNCVHRVVIGPSSAISDMIPAVLAGTKLEHCDNVPKGTTELWHILRAGVGNIWTCSYRQDVGHISLGRLRIKVGSVTGVRAVDIHGGIGLLPRTAELARTDGFLGPKMLTETSPQGLTDGKEIQESRQESILGRTAQFQEFIEVRTEWVVGIGNRNIETNHGSAGTDLLELAFVGEFTILIELSFQLIWIHRLLFRYDSLRLRLLIELAIHRLEIPVIFVIDRSYGPRVALVLGGSWCRWHWATA